MSAAMRVAPGDVGWPERFVHLRQPPGELWVLGGLPAADTPTVAVVGSRRPTPGGLLTARDIGFQVAAAGVVVVSGMARGVDGAAHRGALDAGGLTVAVLGCGIERCYPPEHARLRDDIAERGAVVSEDGGDAPPDTWRFPRRNRLIAALCEAVVVVEASEKSGALSTARWAADLGREVLAVPGSIRQPGSRGTNLLIRDGVRPYLGISDLFEAAPQLRRALTLGTATAGGPPGSSTTAHRAVGDNPLLSRLLTVIGADPVHPDDLALTLGVPAADLAAALTTLTLRGAVTDVWGGRVARTF
ncbi:MAG: DNA-processing protein DprA [Candidatus Dormibacteraeota bacterium]|nr:DNA-processing protein DprA [Candidatus Dormibacteraeota bacterium]